MPVVGFPGGRTADDPAAILDGQALVKWTAIHQRSTDLHVGIPTFDEVQAARLAKTEIANRIARLKQHPSEGGFGLDASTPQVLAEERKLNRAVDELTRLETLREVRTQRWNSVGALDRSVSDWVLRGGIPQAVERYRHRLRELAADRHRVRSSPWPAAVAKAAAAEMIDRRADAAAPNLELAIEHNMPITCATTRLTAGPQRRQFARCHRLCRSPRRHRFPVLAFPQRGAEKNLRWA